MVAFGLGFDTGDHTHRIWNEFGLTWSCGAQRSDDVLWYMDGRLRSGDYLWRKLSLSKMRKAVFLDEAGRC